MALTRTAEQELPAFAAAAAALPPPTEDNPLPLPGWDQILAVLMAFAAIASHKLAFIAAVVTSFVLFLRLPADPSPNALWGAGMFAGMVLLATVILTLKGSTRAA